MKPARKTRLHGYTIVETLVAAGLLVIAIAASAALALTMVSQEEANARVARALNLQEQAGRLYQLGLSPDEIVSILPPEENVLSFTFSASAPTVEGVGAVEIATCRMIFHAGSPMTAEEGDSPAFRTNDVVLVRPTIR